jgi:hypothetical protein
MTSHIHFYAFRDCVLCFLLTVFMHTIENFYDDEYDVSHHLDPRTFVTGISNVTTR